MDLLVILLMSTVESFEIYIFDFKFAFLSHRVHDQRKIEEEINVFCVCVFVLSITHMCILSIHSVSYQKENS